MNVAAVSVGLRDTASGAGPLPTAPLPPGGTGSGDSGWGLVGVWAGASSSLGFRDTGFSEIPRTSLRQGCLEVYRIEPLPYTANW